MSVTNLMFPMVRLGVLIAFGVVATYAASFYCFTLLGLVRVKRNLVVFLVLMAVLML